MAASFPCEGLRDARLVIVGGVYVDVLNEVAAYPEEDSSCRALSSARRRGGNAGNSAVVLARLLAAHAPDCTVSWMGVVPSASNADAAFALAELARDAIDTSLLEEAGGDAVGQPTSFITLSRTTGSRTIVSTRNGCRELSAEHFARALALADAQAGSLGEPAWCHLECREMPSVARMAEAYRAHRVASVPGAGARWRFLSIEVEKPHMEVGALLPVFALCDAIFLSREFLERNQRAILGGGGGGGGRDGCGQSGAGAEHLAVRCLRALLAQSPGCRALWMVGWGSLGAFALDSVPGASHFQPAFPPKAVVDSVGAGDTFIGASIFALASGAGAEQALRCGCAVAGAKVGRAGFDGLPSAVTCCRAAACDSPSNE